LILTRKRGTPAFQDQAILEYSIAQKQFQGSPYHYYLVHPI